MLDTCATREDWLLLLVSMSGDDSAPDAKGEPPSPAPHMAKPDFKPQRVPDGDVERQRPYDGQRTPSQLGRRLLVRIGTMDELRWNAGNYDYFHSQHGPALDRSSTRASQGRGRRGSRGSATADRQWRGQSVLSPGGGPPGSRGSHAGSHLGEPRHHTNQTSQLGGSAAGTAHGRHHSTSGLPVDDAHCRDDETFVRLAGVAEDEADDFMSAASQLPGRGKSTQDGAGMTLRELRLQATIHGLRQPSTKAEFEQRSCGPLWSLLRRWQGGIDTAIPRPQLWYDLITMPLGACLALLWLSSLNRFGLPTMNLRVLNPTFGATAVLLFAVPESKLAQPRNLLGGQLISVVIGCLVRNAFANSLSWVAAPVALFFAILAMQLTRTIHAPAGATAVMVASQTVYSGWNSFIFLPAVLIGDLGMFVLAMVFTLAPGRRYPTFWWGADTLLGGL